MAVEMVPWAVHGTKHSAAVARTALYASTGGAHGVGSPTDMRVRATQTPSNQVRVSPGSALLVAGDPSASQQSYTMRNVTETLVNIPASGSSGARTWWVCAVVTDPQFEGEQPADPLNHAYATIEALEEVPEGGTVEVLARVVVPANTSTITGNMITDMRNLAQPKREEYVFGRPRVLGDSSAGVNLTVRHANGGEYFPGGDGSPNQFRVPVPAWCNRFMVDADWMGVRYQANRDVYGNYWVEFGDEYRDRTWPGNRQWEFATEIFAFIAAESSDAQRTNWRLMDGLYMPPKLRGKTVTFAFKASLSAASDLGVSMDHLGGLGMRLTFAQQPLSGDLL